MPFPDAAFALRPAIGRDRGDVRRLYGFSFFPSRRSTARHSPNVYIPAPAVVNSSSFPQPASGSALHRAARTTTPRTRGLAGDGPLPAGAAAAVADLERGA